jgi:hypothetical protein
VEAAGSFRDFGKFLPNYTASLAQTDGQRIGSDFGGSGVADWILLPFFHLFEFEGRRNTADCVESGSTLPLPGSEGNTSHHVQVGGPFTVGFTTKFLYAFISIIIIIIIIITYCN